jgi:hypothetical protein
MFQFVNFYYLWMILIIPLIQSYGFSHLIKSIVQCNFVDDIRTKHDDQNHQETCIFETLQNNAEFSEPINCEPKFSLSFPMQHVAFHKVLRISLHYRRNQFN